ncbi:MAG: hypothetical protein JNL82_29835 [Myxococcales bacterium]|nr:hypothetical protein [Myxococcales bacterium]
MANETTTTSWNDIIHSEAVNEIILAANRPPAIYQAVAYMRDAAMAGSGVYKFPKWAKTDVPAGVKTEATGAFTVVESTTDGVSATAGMVGLGRVLSDEAAQDSFRGIADLIMQNEAAGGERLTKDLLGLFTSATNTEAFGNVAFNLTRWGTAKFTFEALNPVGTRRAFIGSMAAMRGLEADMRTTGAAFLANPLNLGAGIMMQPGQGYRGMFEGYEVFASSLCPDNDADTISSAFAMVGELGALGLAVWKSFRHIPEDDPEHANVKLWTSARYAVAITNQANLLEVTTED